MLPTCRALIDTRGPTTGVATVTDVAWSSRFRLHHRLANAYRHERLFLMGDAAHVHSPAGGQGMNTGLVDACVLGRLLATVVSGKQPESALDQYQILRRPAAEQVLRLAGRLTDRRHHAESRQTPAEKHDFCGDQPLALCEARPRNESFRIEPATTRSNPAAVGHHGAGLSDRVRDCRDEDRVTELVRQIAMRLCLVDNPIEHGVILERAQQFVMAGPWLVQAGDECIDDVQSREWPHAQCCDRRAIPYVAVTCRGVFERAHDGRPDGNDRPPPRRVAWISRAVDAGMRYGSSRGRSASSSTSPVEEMPAACVIVANAAPRASKSADDAPVEQESSRRRFERHGKARDSSPGIPNRQRLREYAY